MAQPKPERVLRMTGSYYRAEGLTEEAFYEFMSRRHGVECAKIHERYGILKYQMAFSTKSTRALAESMKVPYGIDEHDLLIEYYFKDVSSLLDLSADEDFKALHVEAAPYVRLDETTVSLSWIEVYLDNGQLSNMNSEGKSLQPPFVEQSDIKVSDKPVANYYES